MVRHTPYNLLRENCVRTLLCPRFGIPPSVLQSEGAEREGFDMENSRARRRAFIGQHITYANTHEQEGRGAISSQCFGFPRVRSAVAATGRRAPQLLDAHLWWSAK